MRTEIQRFRFLRQRSGLEADLLLTTPEGVWGLEAKVARRLGSSDWRSLREVGQVLGPQWRGGLVVYNGTTLERVETNLWALPVDRLLVGRIY